MTSLRELERHLIANGCELVRHGSRHDVWRSAGAERPVTVPRHRKIPFGTARAICRQLRISRPAALRGSDVDAEAALRDELVLELHHPAEPQEVVGVDFAFAGFQHAHAVDD